MPFWPFRRIPRRVLLELDLDSGLVEEPPRHPIGLALRGGGLPVRDVVDALRRARADTRVVGLFARIGGGPLGLAQADEIRDAVAAFRRAGKPAVLFSESFGELAGGHSGYYVATAFDQIWLQPSGDVGLTGMAAPVPFLRRALDRLGLEPRLDQREEYKSIVNIFREEGFTEPHRESVEAVLRSLFDRIIETAAEARGLESDRMRALVDAGPLFAPEALAAGLVDELGYSDEAHRAFEARAGRGIRRMDVRRYLAIRGRPHRKGRTVALIYAVGTIRRGRSGFSTFFGPVAGSDTVRQAFRLAIRDRKVSAIVLRIDSPGGSYVASDAIWRETVRAREAGKPVIVSMGNAAASGGYFIAMAADRIVAQPGTLTGSIGVAGGKLVTRGLWERLGVDWDDVRVGEHAGMWSLYRDFTAGEWERIQRWLDRVYQDFTTRVAEGRRMDPGDVQDAARGRVWTGSDALRLGLVDELGGLPRALELARSAAGIPEKAPVRVKVYPPPRSPLQLALARFRGQDPDGPTVAAELLAGLAPLAGAVRVLGLNGCDDVLLADLP